ncbi:MAG: hypothetical protein M3552_07900 [Planctomycetota bacterium]|nr:hypothetical protein [Planctomycetaceae bacterium]MDQ3330561.1 hypothetical protein [Planctomycetota bacterium]
MSTTIGSTAFDRGVEPVREVMTPELARGLLAFRPDASVQDRIEELGRKANEGELSPDEQEEYEGYSRANKFIAILQSQARKRLSDG